MKEHSITITSKSVAKTMDREWSVSNHVGASMPVYSSAPSKKAGKESGLTAADKLTLKAWKQIHESK